MYVGSSDINLYAINPNDTLKWCYTTGINAMYPNVHGDFYRPPSFFTAVSVNEFTGIFRCAKINTLMVDKKGRKIRFPSDNFRKW